MVNVLPADNDRKLGAIFDFPLLRLQLLERLQYLRQLFLHNLIKLAL